LGDIGVGLMTWLNIIALLLLQKPALAALRDYEALRGVGQDPVYRPAPGMLPTSTVWAR
jgi:AGCS family alanine or glycine:cation symporter